MAKFSRKQIAVMARAAGWGTRSEDVSWVAMAESSGHSETVNEINCVGLLQINQPAHRSSHPKWTVKWLQDPINNLSAGRVLFKAAGNSFDKDWADSKSKGGIPEGWGPHVTGSGGGGDATQTKDDPCELLKGTPGYDYCVEDNTPGGGGDDFSITDTAEQIGRLAQAVAKAGNWLADPGNWVRIAYVTGGGLLALTAVSVIIRPYTAGVYGQVMRALPVKTVKDIARQSRRNPSEES